MLGARQGARRHAHPPPHVEHQERGTGELAEPGQRDEPPKREQSRERQDHFRERAQRRRHRHDPVAPRCRPNCGGQTLRSRARGSEGSALAEECCHPFEDIGGRIPRGRNETPSPQPRLHCPARGRISASKSLICRGPRVAPALHGGEWKTNTFLKVASVADLMVSDVVTVSPDESLAELTETDMLQLIVQSQVCAPECSEIIVAYP